MALILVGLGEVPDDSGKGGRHLEPGGRRPSLDERAAPGGVDQPDGDIEVRLEPAAEEIADRRKIPGRLRRADRPGAADVRQGLRGWCRRQ